MMKHLVTSLYRQINLHPELDSPGMEGYLLVIEMLESRIRIGSFEELAFFLEVAWLKSSEQRPMFRALLEGYRDLVREFITFLREESPAPAPSTDSVTPEKGAPVDKGKKPLGKDGGKEAEVNVEPTAEPVSSAMGVKGEGNGGLAFSPGTSEQAATATVGLDSGANAATELSKSPFIFTKDYLPVRSRHLQQAWRMLGADHFVTDVQSIDLPQTVRQVAVQGYFSDFCLNRRPVSKRRLILLIDRSESMVAVEDLGTELAATVAKNETAGRFSAWYFDRLPGSASNEGIYVVNSEDWMKETPLDTLFAGTPRKDIAVMIYSDAGVFQPLIDPERVQQTEVFLRYLRARAGHIAWVNPAPRQRWKNHPPGYLQKMRMSPGMFEATRRGIERAIISLKGKKTLMDL